MGARPLPAGSLNGLLQPSLGDHVARAEGDARPWRVGSQIYVAILGGPVAVTVIALVNAARLRLPSAKRWLIAAVGVLATALAAGFMVAAPDEARILAQLAGALAAGPQYLIQRAHDRAYFAFSPHEEEEAYASLWGPGTIAVIAGMLVLVFIAGAAGL